jgi:hypothetical protein
MRSFFTTPVLWRATPLLGAAAAEMEAISALSPRCRRAGPVFFFVFGLDPATLRLGQTKPPADLAVLEK